MKSDALIKGLSYIDDIYIEEAENIASRRRKTVSFSKRWIAAIAAVFILFAASVPVLASKTDFGYNALYTVYPAAAQYFKPVQISCEDNGILMTVDAVYIHDNTAEILISMEDLEGGRIDETVDLFDSYNINTPFDSTGHCEFISYDENENKATFLTTIEHWNGQKIMGNKLTFSVNELLTGKKEFDGKISGIALTDAELNPKTKDASFRGMGGIGISREEIENIPVLDSDGVIITPTPGVSITAIGYVGSDLHIQVYYEDIKNTDNHGYISLKNKENGKELSPYIGASFFDEAENGSFEEYVFRGISYDDLENYELYGNFITADPAIKGDWEVTFPLENTK